MPIATKRSFSRADLTALLDRAIDEHGSVIIKRPGRRDLAVIPAEMLRDIDTTDYLFASKRNRRRLQASIRNARQGRGQVMTVPQLRREFGLSK